MDKGRRRGGSVDDGVFVASDKVGEGCVKFGIFEIVVSIHSCMLERVKVT